MFLLEKVETARDTLQGRGKERTPLGAHRVSLSRATDQARGNKISENRTNTADNLYHDETIVGNQG